MFDPKSWLPDELTLAGFRAGLEEQTETWRKVIRLSPEKRRSRTLNDLKRQERESRRWRGIIDAMTPAERQFPFVKVDGWRVRRIARGAGVDKSEVVDLLASVKEANVIIARARLGRGPAS